MKFLIFLFALILFCSPVLAVDCGSALILDPKIYSSGDFPSSQHWRGSTAEDDEWSRWAAETSNKAIEETKSTSNIQSILNLIAQKRFALAEKQHTPDQAAFGKKRGSSNNIGLFSKVASVLDSKSPFYSLIQEKLKGTSLTPESQFQFLGVQKYFLQNGAPVDSSSWFVDRGSFNVAHPVASLDVLMQDVYSRLDLTVQKTHLQKLTDFIDAIYGFYNATPFQRGSAAIGRVFFASMYYALFGHKIPLLPDGLDIYAMLLSQEEFHRFSREFWVKNEL